MKYSLLLFNTLLFGYLSIFDSIAQITHKIGVEAQYGVIIPHAPDLRSISSSNPYGLELSYSRLNSSKQSWEVCNCFYYLGAQLTQHDFGNPDVLGRATSLSTFFEPILWSANKLEFTLKSGMGISYLSQVFDEETNPENIFFSSPLSFIIFLQPKLSYRINDQLEGNFSLIYNHISNGGQSQPNRGINYPMAGLGLSYVMGRQKLPSYTPEQKTDKVKFYIDFFSTHRKTGQGDERSFLYGSSLGGYYKILPVSALGGGLEVYNDQSLVQDGDSAWSSFLAAPYIAHHFTFGRFDFSQRFAYYLHKPEHYTDNTFYQRYIIQYGIWENLQLGVGMKAHGHVAENIDLRLGWKF